jgi:hypothetical protein
MSLAAGVTNMCSTCLDAAQRDLGLSVAGSRSINDVVK